MQLGFTTDPMKRVIYQRIKDGQRITEVWLKEGEKLEVLYKKLEE